MNRLSLYVTSLIKQQMNNKFVRILIFVGITLIIMTNESAASLFGRCQTTEELKAVYGSCYVCKIFEILLRSLADTSIAVYPVIKDACLKLMVILFALWIVFEMLQKLSSLGDVNPRELIFEIVKKLFKMLLAYAAVMAGPPFIIEYIVEPIVLAAADFGMAISDGGECVISSGNSGSLFPSTVESAYMCLINQIFDLLIFPMVMGHALMCYATHAGAPSVEILGKTIVKFFDVLDWIKGAIIYVIGILLMIAVPFKLLDSLIKIALGIMLMPLAFVFYVFNVTKKYAGKILNSISEGLGIYVFTIILVLLVKSVIEASIGGIDQVFQYLDQASMNDSVRDDMVEKIDSLFSIWSATFILLVASVIFGILFIAQVPQFANLFIPSGGLGKGEGAQRFGGQMMSMAKGKAKKVGTGLKNAGTNATKAGVRGAMNKFGKKGSGSGDGAEKKGIGKLKDKATNKLSSWANNSKNSYGNKGDK